MLGRRHRRSLYSASAVQSRPRIITRVILLCVTILILWYLGAKVVSLFNGSASQKTGAILTLSSADAEGVQVSLQGAAAQRAENNLKVYPGDAIITRGGSTALLSFFDGTAIRLDESTQLSIVKSEQLSDKPSAIAAKVLSGRIWVSTPAAGSLSGTIIRSVETPDFTVDVPANTSGLISASQIAFIRAAGLGSTTTLKHPPSAPKTIVIGEGQMFTLTESAKKDVDNGRDPYDFRDPISQQLLHDAFLVKSYALAKEQTGIVAISGSTTAINSADLTVTNPAIDQVLSSRTIRVSGKVSDAVATVRVNNYEAPIAANKTFGVEINLPADGKNSLHIEAQDSQGITIADDVRSVTVTVVSNVKPVHVSSPVTGIDQTYITGSAEVEVTGDAPAGTQAIMVNDYKLQLFKPGSRTWSYLASAALGNLALGKNVLSIVALDKDGNKSEPVTLTIDYKPGTVTSSSVSSSEAPLKQNAPLKPGSLTVTSPQSGTAALSSEKEIVIEGTTDALTDSLSVNGYTLQLYKSGKTTWNYIASVDLATMKRGKNEYRIVSRNAAGEILDVLEYTIDYQP